MLGGMEGSGGRVGKLLTERLLLLAKCEEEV